MWHSVFVSVAGQWRRDAKIWSTTAAAPAVLIVDLCQSARQISNRSGTICMDSANGAVDWIFLQAKIDIAGVFALFVPEFRAILAATRYRLAFEVPRGVTVFPGPRLAAGLPFGPSNGLHLEPHAASILDLHQLPMAAIPECRPPC